MLPSEYRFFHHQTRSRSSSRLRSDLIHKNSPLPFFWRSCAALVLALVFSGCSAIGRLCELGPSGDAYTSLKLFLSWGGTTLLVSLIAFGVIFFIQYRRLKKWDPSQSEPPQSYFNWLTPVIIAIIVLVLILLFVGAECTYDQKLVSSLGLVAGCMIGLVVPFLVFRYAVKKITT